MRYSIVVCFIALVVAVALSGCSGSKGSSTAHVEDGIQVAETQLQVDSYEEVTVQKGVPVRWNLKADGSKLTNCNETVIIPALGIEKKLVAGDNFIEFTPKESGQITYTCWMGMISSKINVVDSL